MSGRPPGPGAAATTQCSTRIARRCAGRATGRCRPRRRCRVRWSQPLVHQDTAVDARARRPPPAPDGPDADARHEQIGRRAPRHRRAPHAAFDALGSRPRWKTTPCSSWIARIRSPSSGPNTRSSGRASGATTWTSILRARSEAATSRPMKLAPRTTARLPCAPRRDDARGCRRGSGGSEPEADPTPCRQGVGPDWPRWRATGHRSVASVPSSNCTRRLRGSSDVTRGPRLSSMPFSW